MHMVSLRWTAEDGMEENAPALSQQPLAGVRFRSNPVAHVEHKKLMREIARDYRKRTKES